MHNTSYDRGLESSLGALGSSFSHRHRVFKRGGFEFAGVLEASSALLIAWTCRPSVSCIRLVLCVDCPSAAPNTT